MKKRLLKKDDVIKTHPRDGFWGCAVVISERDKTEDMDPACHIAITPVVYRHNYDFAELDVDGLTVMEFGREYRLEPSEVFTKKELLIGVYSRRVDDSVNIMGSIDTSHIYDGPLPFQPFSDLAVTYPLYGSVNADALGSEAVASWRRVHDKIAWDEEVAKADEEHWALMERIKKGENRKDKFWVY